MRPRTVYPAAGSRDVKKHPAKTHHEATPSTQLKVSPPMPSNSSSNAKRPHLPCTLTALSPPPMSICYQKNQTDTGT